MTASALETVQQQMESLSKPRSVSVCIVVENLPVPADRRVWSEARALRDAGYTVSVISPKGKSSFRASYELLEGIHVYRHSMWEASSGLGYLLEYSWAFLAEMYLVLKVFVQRGFEILQGCNPPDNLFLLALLLRPFGVRYIFDHHDLSPELVEVKFGRNNRLISALTRLAEKCSFKVAKVSIATNESFKDIAMARGGKQPENVFVVRNCPDLKTLRRQPFCPEIKKGKPLLVLYVGIMAQQDGLDLLLDSIEYVVRTQKRNDTHFLLVGGGVMLSTLRVMVGRKGLQEFVTLTGQVPHDKVVEYLSAADVGVAPDPKTPMNDNSTMIKIFEYMAFGLPIVLFDLKEGRNVAGPAALYAKPNDPVDFASQLSKLLDSGELRSRLGASGSKRVEERLNWETEKRSLLEAYAAARAN